jgi:hypothetical protein
MKPGKEIARFEHRAWADLLQGRTYMISLRECGSTLYRVSDPNTPKVTNVWRRVRGWAVKFPNLDAARADYLKRGYVELPATGSAQAHTY